MKMIETKIRSRFDDLDLSVLLMPAKGETRGLLQIVHGMAENKERYTTLMEYLSERGWASVIHDHRGHGASVKSPEDLGYMYEGGWNALVEDVLDVQEWAKNQLPGAKVSLMGHSMGSMVVRSFAKRYDDRIEHLIVCGCPSDNPAKGVGKLLASTISTVLGSHHRSSLLNDMSFGSFNKPYKSDGPNSWLSVNKANVKAYNESPLCGFCFTANGFENLLSLMQDCYSPKGWKLRNPSLPVLFISGGDDPCRTSDAAFSKAVEFMKERGYTNVASRLYPGLRHEILLEETAPTVYADIAEFISQTNTI